MKYWHNKAAHSCKTSLATLPHARAHRWEGGGVRGVHCARQCTNTWVRQYPPSEAKTFQQARKEISWFPFHREDRATQWYRSNIQLGIKFRSSSFNQVLQTIQNLKLEIGGESTTYDSHLETLTIKIRALLQHTFNCSPVIWWRADLRRNIHIKEMLSCIFISCKNPVSAQAKGTALQHLKISLYKNSRPQTFQREIWLWTSNRT